MRDSSGTPCERVQPFMKKTNKSVQCAGEFNTPNKIQRVTGVALGGMEGVLYIAGWYADGNHRVPNVNRNSDGDFKFNLGNFENDWNDDNCLLCFCNSFAFSHYLLVGVLSEIFFFQPPSIRPTSSKVKMSAPYCV